MPLNGPGFVQERYATEKARGRGIVLDLERGVSELARVLRTGGRLVAVTNSLDHLREIAELIGVRRAPSPFNGENATK